jgi:protocatechuate 3,4-dioxygenase beta subunit
MRNVNAETLTQVLLDTFSDQTDERLAFVLERLVHHLHAFAKETDLTHAEWRKGIELLTKAGEITDDERNEFVLFSDVLGLSSLVDMLHSPDEVTSSSVLGPFHILGAPEVAIGSDIKGDNAGASVVIKGKVSDVDGNAITGAVMELWQTADNGLYSNQDPAQDRYNLRARINVADDGHYSFTTVRPAPYTVPDNGPVGELLHGTGRHPWRPSHLHFIVLAEGYRTLVTEVFPADDPYLDEDAVFGVREDLVMTYQPHSDNNVVPDEIVSKNNLTDPFYLVEFDFVLAREG